MVKMRSTMPSRMWSILPASQIGDLLHLLHKLRLRLLVLDWLHRPLVPQQIRHRTSMRLWHHPAAHPQKGQPQTAMLRQNRQPIVIRMRQS